MDFQNVVDSIDSMACVMSVEKLDGGRYGKLCIVAGNSKYRLSIEDPVIGADMKCHTFIPGSEYTKYLTRDLNFEAFCYGAAVQKKCLHAYAHPERLPGWFNMTYLPLSYEEDNLCYCIYIMEINYEPNSKRIANISESVAAGVLETCVKLSGTNDFKATMHEIIEDVRSLCHAEYCCILLLNKSERKCEILSDSCAKGSSHRPIAETMAKCDFYAMAESWIDTIAGSNCLVIKNEQEMEVVKERNHIWYESLKSADVQRIVLFPLKSHDEVLGYIWATNFDAKDSFKIKETLELTTFVLGSELGNHLLMERLKVLSSKDMLTGVMNRNEMNYVVDRLVAGAKEGKSVGVIFADLNGLKVVNDEKGHVAGDSILRTAAKVLLEVFPVSAVFRAGGDEFTIIIDGATEAEIAAYISKIRTVSENRVSFSLGGCVEADSRNIRSALRIADELMYADKNAFYAQHPEKKYR